jgi:hypothetical protein
MQDAYTRVTKLTSAHTNLQAAAICLRIGIQPSNDLSANLNELSTLFLVSNQFIIHELLKMGREKENEEI